MLPALGDNVVFAPVAVVIDMVLGVLSAPIKAAAAQIDQQLQK